MGYYSSLRYLLNIIRGWPREEIPFGAPLLKLWITHIFPTYRLLRLPKRVPCPATQGGFAGVRSEAPHACKPQIRKEGVQR